MRPRLERASFLPHVVKALKAKDPRYVDTSSAGGMVCPIHGERERPLPWVDGNYRKGTVSHAGVRFHVSPTFVYDDPRDNFISGYPVLEQLLESKAETWRLGNENSEDALSWNFFRSLQEAGKLGDAYRVLTGMVPSNEPDLLLWGHRIETASAAGVPELQDVLDRIEPRVRGRQQQTEPDVVLRDPEHGWVFIEAKLGSPTSTFKGREHKLEAWMGRYPVAAPEVFSAAGLAGADPGSFPEQILRNATVAAGVARGEQAHVVGLVRRVYAPGLEEAVKPFLDPAGPISFTRATWEDLGEDLWNHPKLVDLHSYIAGKSYGLERAFELT